MRNYQTAFHEAQLSDRQNFETWTDRGGTDMVQRANARWKADLAAYEAPPIDPGINEALQAFLAHRKEALPDIWH